VNESAQSLPLPTQLGGVSATVNGVAAPLYYVSSGQINIQIPYETAVSGKAQLTVSNAGQTASATFSVVAAAPGIFTGSNGAPVGVVNSARGSVITLYMTGDGAVSPALATGATPSSSTALANLPKPVQSTSVTVGNVPAVIQFIGITPGLTGVTQINVQIPSSAPTGAQPVVVTVGTASSPSATITVN
jgi:uncharacterized protein (TIGR03437 family)